MANQKCTNCSITFSPKNSLRCLVGNKSYSLMNIRQLHILFNLAKTWHVIVCWFLCFPPNLPELNLKLFWTSEQNNFRFSSGKFGENTEINKQSHVKFWLNWIEYGAVSYSLSCNKLISNFHFLGDIVSVEDVDDGSVYYAQLRGFLTDQYCEKSGVITWLLPTVNR